VTDYHGLGYVFPTTHCGGWW